MVVAPCFKKGKSTVSNQAYNATKGAEGESTRHNPNSAKLSVEPPKTLTHSLAAVSYHRNPDLTLTWAVWGRNPR